MLQVLFGLSHHLCSQPLFVKAKVLLCETKNISFQLYALFLGLCYGILQQCRWKGIEMLIGIMRMRMNMRMMWTKMAMADCDMDGIAVGI